MLSLNPGDKIKINSDNWNDLGKIYIIESAKERYKSTAVEITLNTGDVVVVPSHYIEKIYE